MKELPIRFSGPMVRAILDGSKTQTRRVVKPQPEWVNENAGCGIATGGGIMPSPRSDWLHWRGSRLLRPEPRCPYGQTGDRITVDRHPDILLEITDVRVEKLQDISEDDALGEGIERATDFPGWYRGPLDGDSDGLAEAGRHFKIPTAFAKLAFRALWESINGPDSWAANPWVWVIEFRRIEP